MDFNDFFTGKNIINIFKDIILYFPFDSISFFGLTKKWALFSEAGRARLGRLGPIESLIPF